MKEIYHNADMETIQPFYAQALKHDYNYSQTNMPFHVYVERELTYKQMNYIMYLWHSIEEDTRWIDMVDHIAKNKYVRKMELIERSITASNTHEIQLEYLRKEECVYISGAMTGNNGFNYNKFHQVQKYLQEYGVKVFNPANRGRQEGWKHNDYLRDDMLEICRQCSAVIKMDNWFNSIGAWEEVRTSRLLFKMNMYNLHDDGRIGFSW